MELSHLKLTVDNGVATVLINRHEKGNSLSPEVLTEMAELFEDLSVRTDVTVIILTGGEKIFAAGFDLDYIKTLRKGDNEAFIALYWRTYRSIKFCSVPVIAAIGGAAIAGGFDLTQMCDIRYASTRAKFSQREVLISLVPVLDPLWKIIGLGHAMEWSLTGKMIDVEEAYRLGFISTIFPEGSVVEETTKIARNMATCERTCLVETKKMTLDILNMSLDGSMKYHDLLFRTYAGSEENLKRVDQVLENIRSSKKK